MFSAPWGIQYSAAKSSWWCLFAVCFHLLHNKCGLCNKHLGAGCSITLVDVWTRCHCGPMYLRAAPTSASCCSVMCGSPSVTPIWIYLLAWYQWKFWRNGRAKAQHQRGCVACCVKKYMSGFRGLLSFLTCCLVRKPGFFHVENCVCCLGLHRLRAGAEVSINIWV